MTLTAQDEKLVLKALEEMRGPLTEKWIVELCSRFLAARQKAQGQPFAYSVGFQTMGGGIDEQLVYARDGKIPFSLGGEAKALYLFPQIPAGMVPKAEQDQALAEKHFFRDELKIAKTERDALKAERDEWKEKTHTKYWQQVDALAVQNQELREALNDEHSLRLGYKYRNNLSIVSKADAILAAPDLSADILKRRDAEQRQEVYAICAKAVEQTGPWDEHPATVIRQLAVDESAETFALLRLQNTVHKD